MLGLQPVQPGQLPGILELVVGRLGQGQVIRGVPVVRLGPVPAIPQPVQRELPDRAQQLEP